MKLANTTKKIVVIGGGTGTYVLLSGLKKYTYDLTALITMMDSGGSTGRLRDQLGVLPPGDLRQALVALSESSKIWRNLFLYRFESGDLKGHNFGNIFISALEKITGSIEQALTLASELLKTSGKVIPITFDKTNLCVELVDGSILQTEGVIDEEDVFRSPIKRVFLNPKASANRQALQELSNADYIVFGPGDLYTSILPNLVVSNVKSCIHKSLAKKVFVMNLMTKPGQTNGYTASKHLHEIEKYAGCNMDHVIINNKKPDRISEEFYQKFSTSIVLDDINDSKYPKTVFIRKNIISTVHYTAPKSDLVHRSIIRHDSNKLAKEIDLIINNDY